MATAATKKPGKKGAEKARKSPAAARTPPPLPRSALEPKDDLVVDPDALEFIAAIAQYKKFHSRPFPSWSEVLFVLKQLGYRKVPPAG